MSHCREQVPARCSGLCTACTLKLQQLLLSIENSVRFVRHVSMLHLLKTACAHLYVTDLRNTALLSLLSNRAIVCSLIANVFCVTGQLCAYL